MKVISLFSGAGGLDLGIIQAGNEIIWANDIDKDAVATYRENIGKHIVHDDIKNIDLSLLPDADVVVGGFPCQGFSQVNTHRVLNDERNELYKFFYEVVKVKQPKFFIAENVKGILSYGKGEAIPVLSHNQDGNNGLRKWVSIIARGNGGGGVCAIPHYNGECRLTIRESASVQTFPEKFYFIGSMNACYRQIGNAVPVKFAKLLGEELVRIEKEEKI